MKQLNRKPLVNAISLAITGSALAATVVLPVHAQDDDFILEEVIVTATKRAESMQDIPVSLQVLGNKQLQELQIRGFEDYMVWMPTVSYTSNGPGYGIVYMRGIASGGDGLHSGSMPSVGVYLDEQPITTINEILDLHVYDVARIETLSGPQGTLFGQGSQAGTIRIITNKPLIGLKEGGYDLTLNTTKSGDPGYNLEGFVNIPMGDRAAVRLVAWHKKLGGYIDNVPSELEYAASGIVIDNEDLVEKNYNEAEASGLRALLKIELSDNWALTPGIMYQKSEAEGIWAHNPKNVGDLEVARFFPDEQDEDWYQASLTLEGEIGDLNLVYAGAYLDRDRDYLYDYSGYAEYWEQWYAYYNYYYGGYYCFYYDETGGCSDPSQFQAGDENFNRMSHEVRLQSSQDQRFRWIAGLFYQRQEHFFDLQWVLPDLNPADTVVENGLTAWQTHQKRIDRDKAAFGEVYFDITDNFTAIGGIRWFDYENSLFGFNGRLSRCIGFYDEDGNFTPDPDGEPQFPCFNTGVVDDVQEGDDVAFKGSLEYRIGNQKMVYVTYSEGFRAGGVNRANLGTLPSYEPDWVYNYEFGWKTTWAGGRFRFNGAVYLLDWENFQFTFLDFSVSPLSIIQNVGNARTKGIEWDMDWAATENFTLSFAGSYNDAKLREGFWRDDEDQAAGLPANAPKGTVMPYVPELQLTAIGRFNFDLGSLPSFAQIALSYTDKAWSDLDLEDRRRMDSYTVLNLSAGIQKDNWSLTFYANNVTDERGQVDIFQEYILPPGYPVSGIDHRENIVRPRYFGISWAQRF